MEIGESVRGEDVYIIQVIHKQSCDLHFLFKNGKTEHLILLNTFSVSLPELLVNIGPNSPLCFY